MKIETEMRIDQAANHLAWRLQQPKMIPNDKDKEAFNVMVTTINQNYQRALIENSLFAKLLIERLLLMTMNGDRSLKQAIEVIKESLNTSLYGWVCEFTKQVPMIRLSRVFEEKLESFTITKEDTISQKTLHAAQKRFVSQFNNEFTQEVTKPYTEEDCIKFIERLVFELTKEFKNKP